MCIPRFPPYFVENSVEIVEELWLAPCWHGKNILLEENMAEKNAKATAGNLTPEALSREIKKGILGAYVFFGEEDFLHQHRQRFFRVPKHRS